MDDKADRWAVMLPLEGHGDSWFVVCRCEKAEAAAEAVRVLIASGDERIKVIRLERTSW